MGRSANNTGRSKRGAKHVRLYEYVLHSDAYRHLDVYARVLLVELGRRYNGSNNGEIHMSYREAAIACNCSEKPIRRAFKQLQETGFIQVAKLGGFNVKFRHATEWILSEHPVGKQLATKEFMSWRKPVSEPVEKNSRRTHSTSTAYLEPYQQPKSKNNETDGVPTVHRDGYLTGDDGVPKGRTYNIPYSQSAAQARGQSKRQAQPCASSVENTEKKSNSEAKILNAVGGFCKIRNLSNEKFQKLVRIDECQQLSEGQIRALVIQAQLQAGAT